MSEVVVYKQSELDRALGKDFKEIVLCAGVYTIPKAKGVIFRRIGPVKATVECTRAEAQACGMVFENIYPTYKPSYAVSSRESMAAVAVTGSGSYGSGSFAGSGSYITSGGSHVGSGGYSYEYEYEFVCGGSMRGSLGGSISGSYSLSYSFSQSSAGSYSVIKSSMQINVGAADDNETIRVFGYGINLI